MLSVRIVATGFKAEPGRSARRSTFEQRTPQTLPSSLRRIHPRQCSSCLQCSWPCLRRRYHPGSLVLRAHCMAVRTGCVGCVVAADGGAGGGGTLHPVPYLL